MRLLILADLHGNLEALEAVLEARPSGTWDRIVVLGDLVGYGADPNAVIDRIRALDPMVVIRGNHDKVAAGLEDAAGFNWMARLAVEWTRRTLTAGNREYLANLPAGPVLVDDTIEVCHGSPHDEDLYVFDPGEASYALARASRPVCFFGHTHVPAIYVRGARGFEGVAPGEGRETVVELRPDLGRRYLINPGSVGQPRDGDPRAACAVYDTDLRRLTLHRQAYGTDLTRAKILAAGLPDALAERLEQGR